MLDSERIRQFNLKGLACGEVRIPSEAEVLRIVALASHGLQGVPATRLKKGTHGGFAIAAKST
jgi:hypothetical protein